jgi:tripeptidyl-peptidase-1
MVSSITAIAALFAASLVSSSPIKARTPYAVKESHFVPPQWSRVGPAHEGSVISLQIGLKQSQFEELERHLYEGTYFRES